MGDRTAQLLRATSMLIACAAVAACVNEQPRDSGFDPSPSFPSPETNDAPGVAGDVAANEPTLREVFPHVRVDVRARVVEVDGFVPIDVNDPDAPDVYLELIACTPDTREHESLVVTAARPSHVHAALLMIGLQPGKPGSWAWDGDALNYAPPEGDTVAVEIRYVNDTGETIVAPAWSWVRAAGTGAPFPERDWVFAGSREVFRQGRTWYDADGAGTLIGLCTFESETVAWPEVISHEAAIHEPVWTAHNDRTPPFGTAATLILRPGAD